MTWLRNLSCFARARDGIAAIEFALCMPFLLALLMGAVEVTRFIVIEQKVEKASSTISDVVAQGTTVSTADLNNIVVAAGQIMNPYSFTTNGYVIVSSVTQTGTQSTSNPPVVSWQYAGGGSMNPAPSSPIGTQGHAATLPAGFTMASGDNVIITEIFYNYTPLMIHNGIMSNQQIYKYSIFKPRLGALTTLSWLWPDLLLKGAIL